MSSIFIVEDELLIAEDLTAILQGAGYNVLGYATGGEEALAQLDQLLPDLVLLDIKLSGKLTGFDVARSIKRETPYLFITSLKDTRSRAEIFSLNPKGFILKPFVEEEILINVQIALRPERSMDKSHASVGFMIRDGAFLRRVAPQDILFAKGEDNYTFIQLVDGKEYLVSHTLKSVEEKLADTGFFYRVHKSYLVNLNHFLGVEGKNVILKDKIIPIGKHFRAGLFKRFDVL